MIEVRRSTPEDFKKVYQIECESYKHPWGMLDFYDDFVENPRSVWFVAVECDVVIGFAGLWIGVEEMHIVNVAVTKSQRKKGVGKTLVCQLLKQAESENISKIFLEVRKSNIPAINLYKGFGFREMYVRKGYYQEDGEDGIVMILENK
jgi:ribosomal-protein-alanine N-acetyltransferase